ncbi:OmpA family protein [Roseateles sp. BYS180W]
MHVRLLPRQGPHLWAALALGLTLSGLAAAQTSAPAPSNNAPARPNTTAQPGMVVVAGTVPDEASRQHILVRLRELYGVDRVVDQLGVAPLAAPPAWSEHVQRILTPELKRVNRGQIAIQGNIVQIKGEVADEGQRQLVVNTLSTQLNNPTYALRNNLRVAGPGQDKVDAALANRVIEFEAGRAVLTATGQAVLDQLLPVLAQLPGRKFEILGHTDAIGARATNVSLSLARADAVKDYLVGKGLAEGLLNTSGVGPDRPVASNDTPEGRARNRRIEFRVVQ